MAKMSLEKDLQIPAKKKKPRGKVNVPVAGSKKITKENVAEMARRGNAAKAAKRQRTEELKEAMATMLALPATGKIKDMLTALGYQEEDQVNASAVAATLFALAMKGEMKAMEIILDYGFRVSDDERKTKEADARISAMAKNGVDVSVNSGGEEGGVVIYLPAIEDENEQGEGNQGNKG